MPLQIKVSGKDNDGANFIFEHSKMKNGGLPMHFHYEQFLYSIFFQIL